MHIFEKKKFFISESAYYNLVLRPMLNYLDRMGASCYFLGGFS